LKCRQWPVASVWQQHLGAGQHLTGQSIASKWSAASKRKKYALVIYGDSGSLCEANLTALFAQKIFHIAKLKRKTNVQHRSKAYDLRALFKVPEWEAFCHCGCYKYSLLASTEFNLTVPI
jgi:hypothetical protein